jgi:hypothetical protein
MRDEGCILGERFRKTVILARELVRKKIKPG